MVQIALFIAVGLTAAKLSNDRRRCTARHDRRFHRSAQPALVRSALATRWCAAAAPARLPIALLVLDLDRLKSLNDTHGHLAGAEAVRTVGHTIADTLPPGPSRAATAAMNSSSRCRDCEEVRARAIADRPASCRQQPRARSGGRAVSRRHAVDQRRDRLLGDDPVAGHAAAVTLSPLLIG